ncbi:MAG: NAD(P)/FAD-dependent oxidoreductase [Eubacteriales bacterium]|nr:NAD(P)/FAD-dependent oxidoreductase [Eubacteriales bacterium]
MTEKIAVIGGGAAGMLAAYAAAQNGAQVTLYEKNEKLGKKIYITGKGRCNVTNGCGQERFFDQVVSNPRFLYSAFAAFDNRAMMRLLEQAGCPLKTERGERVFPVSDHASDVIRALERLLLQSGVKVRLNSRVKRLLTKTGERDGQPLCEITGIELADGKRESADRVILATGGLSYPSTGSTGDGLLWAGELGHVMTETAPALVPFEIREDWCRQLQGLALKNVELSLELAGKEIYRGFGEMLFTHFGISGPLALTAGSYYSAALARKRKKGMDGEQARLFLNLKPALTPEQLDKRLWRDFEEQKNKDFKNALDGLFPARLIPVMTALSGISPDKKVHEITRQERRAFAELIRRVPLTVTGTRGFAEAIITRGGVGVKGINPSTMESKRVKGLYFAGEMLDVDALTGGFNLQIAWSTGYLAGRSASQGGEEG